MLAADKLQLQSSLKQQATALKEKEFNLHHSNLMTVGTQAAVLAGLDVTMLIEFQPPHDSEWGDQHHVSRAIKFIYYMTITAAFCANILVVAQSTVLSVLGSSLALRGPDGSMITATDGLYEERKSIFFAFGMGLVMTVVSVISAAWLILSPEAAIVCVSITLYTMMRMYKAWLRIQRNFIFDESETVDFTDIFEGPAAIMGVSTRGWLARGNGGRARSTVSSATGDAIKAKGSATVDSNESLSSDENYSSCHDRLIPNQSTPMRSNTRGRRRRGAGDRDSDYDIETGSRKSTSLPTV